MLKLNQIEGFQNPYRELATADLVGDQEPSPYPSGIFHALSALSGKPAGYGFYCAKCHFLIRCGLENTDVLKHCGKTETVESYLRKGISLELHRVGTFKR
jgi:hypothetical protein